jgi:pyruvate-ferredoxin/flavodoxin oxidoreductase
VCGSLPGQGQASQTRTCKAINMAPQPPLREQESENWDFFLNLPEWTAPD